MAVDLKQEFTRPLALILAAFAAMGWVLFGLSSWSAASVQKVQRLQIMEATERGEKLSADLARHMAASASLAEIEAKVASTRDDLTRASQAKSDAQAELTTTQRSLAALRRERDEIDRNLQNQNARLNELQPTADTTAAVPDTSLAPAPAARAQRGGRGRWTRRGRASYPIVSRRR
ncbi:hypothetical protein [Enterovirga sp.]|jgi:septal ring factor EnvC (AmiA/AmiB activator)|uniref:hypothetical protein n=1 Tax=Enterovirga sp. TaxID=2026350 RepID=UPI0026076395|nr:hypothetical protein [Enterovirga sp.]MDB5592512.1 hypothetical protein [Enterovirga sp.]